MSLIAILHELLFIIVKHRNQAVRKSSTLPVTTPAISLEFLSYRSGLEQDGYSSENENWVSPAMFLFDVFGSDDENSRLKWYCMKSGPIALLK